MQKCIKGASIWEEKVSSVAGVQCSPTALRVGGGGGTGEEEEEGTGSRAYWGRDRDDENR
ncbi:hypothetical protein E2C01_013215 [Portunus trituberculatus]|uniref:Uncharacterized protein n=1 Tax=Portunus trituberculatus TaxID=210409 RepID=A0A5B7DGH8_PORTR|nr:hypothetical protein [Portunus trituberculatus]